MMPVKVRISWSVIIVRASLFILIWWVLSHGAPLSWLIGIPAVIIAVIVSAVLLPAKPFVWHEFLLFVPFFLIRSLLGGADVAWRAFHPAMPIVPDLIEFSTKLPPGLPQVFMANTISLLPGTLSATLDRSVLKIHVLDSRSDFLAELEVVEQRVARVFGLSLQLSEGEK